MKKLFLLIMASTFAIASHAQSGETGNLTWSINDGTLTISGIGAMPDYTFDTSGIFGDTIPWYYYRYSITNIVISNGVTSIGNRAFYNCSELISVNIPNSVINIGYFAFYNCSGLTSITIPNGITNIGYCAFSGCSNITSIIIPHSVTNIDQGAFEKCAGLTSIFVESRNSQYSSEEGILFNKKKTVLIQYPMGKTDCHYTIPNSVVNLANQAFEGCNNITSVTIPNDVYYIGLNTFGNCTSLTTVNYNATNCVFDRVPPAFTGCTALETVIIGSNVISIPDNAFEGCTEITSFTTPIATTLLRVDMSNLKKLVITSPCTSIPDGAFQNLTSLTSITIPSTVTNIGSNAFAGCTAVENIYAEGTTPPIVASPNAFAGVPKIYTLHVPIGTSSLYGAAQAIGWKDFSPIIDDIASTDIHNITANATFNVSVKDGQAIVKGDVAGKDIAVYNMNGMCIYRDVATTNKTIISLPATGVYIIHIENEAVKIINQ